MGRPGTARTDAGESEAGIEAIPRQVLGILK
jgi:hypothetical protein